MSEENNKEQNIEQDIDIDDVADGIDEEKANDFYEKSSAEAEDMLQNEDKMERFLQKLEHKLNTII